ncbi:HTH iclR-type domain-containing protein [Bordetella tumbae]
MRAFRANGRPTLAELSRAVDLPHATVLRFLQTLEEEGYAARQDSRWRLTPLVFELGFAAMESLGVSEAIQDVLQGLADAYSGTSNLGESHSDGVIIIGRAMAPAERRRLVVMNLRVGSVLPPASALAQGLDLPVGQWTRFDYPDSNQISIATPIPQIDSRRLSVGISVDASEATDGRLENDMAPALQHAADTIKGILRIGTV